MADIMIDIETLGRRNDAAIREVGLVAFESDGTILESVQLSVAHGMWNTHHRTFSGETILWLQKEGSLDLDHNCRSYEVLTEKIDSFFKKHNGRESRVWTKGQMDLEVIKDLYEELGKPLPWEYWQPRDMRTLLDFCKDVVKSPVRPSHKAVEDAVQQAISLCEIKRSLIKL